jgi:hypothetical protein
VITNSQWQTRAKCAELDMAEKGVLDMFYPETGSDKSEAKTLSLHRRAKRFCAMCPVRQQCLEAALEYEEGRWDETKGRWARLLPYGVWGGHTAQKRHMGEIKHLPECPRQGCRGCRSIPNRVKLLEELFQGEIATLLTRKERDASTSHG